jgi:general secretion pathway protein C
MLKRPLIAIAAVSWPVWLATVLAFAALCGAVAYWAMVLLAPPAPIAPAGLAQDARALPELRAASQLFGVTRAEAAAAAPPSTIQVVGVVAAGWRGSAILAVDGKPPKMYTVGSPLTPTQSLVAVRADRVVIDTNGLVQELPAPPKPSLAVLTEGKARASASAPPAPGAAFVAGSPPGSQPPATPTMPAAAAVPAYPGAPAPLPAPAGTAPAADAAPGTPAPQIVGKPAAD